MTRLQLRRKGEVPLGSLPTIVARQYGLRRSVMPQITEQTADGISAFRRGSRLISRTIGMMPLELERNGVMTEETLPLLDRPVPWMSRQAAIESMVSTLIWYGNYFAVLTQFDNMGRAQGLVPVHPFNVVVGLTSSGLSYMVGTELYGSADVLHLRSGGSPGELMGKGVLESSAIALSNAVNVERASTYFYGDGVYPSGVLSADDPDMSQDEADDVRLSWVTRVRRGEPAVLPAGITWQPLASPTAEQAQLNQAAQMSRLQTADLLDMDGDWLGVPNGSMTYANIADRVDNLIRLTCQPWMTCIEDGFTDLTSRPTRVRFDSEELLRTDMTTRYANYQTGLAGKWLTVPEIRREEGLPPLDAPVAELLPPEE